MATTRLAVDRRWLLDRRSAFSPFTMDRLIIGEGARRRPIRAFGASIFGGSSSSGPSQAVADVDDVVGARHDVDSRPPCSRRHQSHVGEVVRYFSTKASSRPRCWKAG